MTKKILLTLILITSTTISTSANTLFVPSEYSTIQLALHRCNDGDTIIVSPGTYLENVNFLGKNVVLTSTDPQNPEIVASTVINGYGSGSAVSFINNESRNAVITGFTISGGYGSINPEIEEGIYWGAGVYCYNSSPTITGNVIANNNGPMKIENNQLAALSYGVGISCLLGGPLITNNIIRNNKGYAGAGIMTYVSDSVISNNLIYDNSAYIGGGVVMLGSTLLINNTIIANDSSNRIEGQEGLAGNVYAASDPSFGYFTIRNNIICNAKSGGGILATDINNSTIEYNNVWNNATGDYLSMDNQTGQISQGRTVNQTGKNGNISLNPLCADMDNKDYHLQMDSPCINTGDPDFVPEPDQTDIDGDPRIFAVIVDIGADEYVGYIKPVADAGLDQYAGPKQLITLDGSGSFIYDPNGILTFQWTQISGPPVELSDPTIVNPTFTPQIQSQYIFELVVSDGLYSSLPDQVTIFVENRAPVADAGSDQSFSSVPDMVTLDGSGSYDPEGEELTYTWRQTSGPYIELNNANTISPSFAPVPTVLTVYIFELTVNDGSSNSQPDYVAVVTGNHAPIADAGSSRYTTNDPIVLDGTGSFDRDGYGEITYEWQQISGPAVNVTGENTATPTISGFVQTNQVQRCTFQLIMSDGELESNPDTVEVIIVPDFGSVDFVLVNPPFDPNKPTIVGFGGGDCSSGSGLYFNQPTDWFENANYLTVDIYDPPYSRYGDALIVYLSNAAPDYTQPIQTAGFSTGNMPAIDVAVQINKTYADERFAVNRVSLLDAACREYTNSISDFHEYALDGEEFWIENYYSTNSKYYPGTLNIRFPAPPAEHSTPASWFLLSPQGNNYNDGVTAGYYISVAGPGKNLRLGPDVDNFYFQWNSQTDYLNFYDQAAYPCKIPEAVPLIGPEDGGAPNLGRSGTVLSCQYSDSAVSYQLLFGPSADCMNYLVSETPNPPESGITVFPFETTYWTVRVIDEYDSSIYTDPIRIVSQKEPASPTIENINTTRQYKSIQSAIDAANDGDEIVVHPGIYEYIENINFKGKAITVRSTDPDDPAVVAATVLNNGLGAAATFSNHENENSILRGFTITGRYTGINCIAASPTIDKCVITNNIIAGIKLQEMSNPTITNCIIADNAGPGIDMSPKISARGSMYNSATITNCTITGNLQQGIYGSNPTIKNSIIYFNGAESDNVQIDCYLPTVAYSDIQGSWPGDGNIDADPLFADSADGDYHLKSQAGRWNPAGQSWIQDDVTSPCIDAGDPLSDIGQEPEPNGSLINMGAYGGTTQASKSL